MIKLWCHIEGKHDYFRVSIPPDRTIDDLKKQIYNEQNDQSFAQCGSSDLALTKVLYIMISI